MRPLRVHIDVTNGTATPAQPDPQTVHLNAAKQQQQRLKIPLPGVVPPAVDAAFPSQPQQQQMEMPLPGVGSPAVGTAIPCQTQQQRMEMPLPEVGSPIMGAASPSRLPQQQMEIPLPGVGPPAMGAAFLSQPQPQRMEMPLPGVATPVPPIAETSPTATPPTALPGEPLSTTPATASPSAASHAASHALLLQTADIPPETARLIRFHNPWPTEDVLFCPNNALPAFVAGIPALSSGLELWIAIHNHRPQPLQLHSGQNIGVLEVVTLADTPPTTSRPGPPRRPPLPERLSLLQQQQLNNLSREFSDVFSQGEDDLGSTPLLEHTIETHGPPLRQPYWRQNPAV